MPEKIIMVGLDKIQPHPHQKEIYGDVYIEPEFLASVKDQGVLIPVILTNPEIYADNSDIGGKWVCVAGHRRIEAAKMAGMKEIPAIIREYESPDICTLNFLALNLQREKYIEQRKNEYFLYKQILGQLAKTHLGKGIYESTNYLDDELLRALKSLKIDPQGPLDSIKILKDLSGFTEWEQRLLKTVEDDDFKIKQYERLRKIGFPLDRETALEKNIQKIRGEYKTKKCTLRDAYNAIKGMLAIEEGLLTKKAKPKKEPKPKEIEEKDDGGSNAIVESFFKGRLFFNLKDSGLSNRNLFRPVLIEFHQYLHIKK